MEANPYTQTANDPTTQAGLMQVLQQIQALQNQPLIPDNPLSQLGAALQGASAGFQGQPNPAIAQAAALRQQQLAGMGQTAGVLGQIGTMKHQEATLAETRRQRALQEKAEARHAKTEDRAQEEASLRISDAAWKRAMEVGDPDMAVVSYRELSKKLPGYFPPMPDEKVRTLAEDAIGREQFKKNQVGMAAAAYLGETTYLGKPIPKDVAALPKRALALLAGKSELQLLHGSMDEWEVALRKKAAAGGPDTLSPDERAEYFAVVGRNATGAKEAALADMQDDITRTGKLQKPPGQYFRIARQRQDLSQPLRQELKLEGIDPDDATPEQMKAAEDRHRVKQIVDAAAKSLKQGALAEYNYRLGHKDKRKDPRFAHIPTEEVKSLAFAAEDATVQLLQALGVTVKGPAAAPTGTVMKNGKTRQENLADLMAGGMDQAKAEREITRLERAGRL